MIPRILSDIQRTLAKRGVRVNKSSDGRNGSVMDEHDITFFLKTRFKDLVTISPPRMWHDILVRNDNVSPWIPVNIKTTTMKTRDNIGNLATVVYAYTKHEMDLEKRYNNGVMSSVLYECLKNKHYNDTARDYYFIVVDKKKRNNVIVNSLRGLTKITGSVHNLPFQVKWDQNKEYKSQSVQDSVDTFLETFPKKNCWKAKFITNLNNLRCKVGKKTNVARTLRTAKRT